MARLFNVLRFYLAQKDIDQIYLGELMKKSKTYVSRRFTGKAEWTLGDIYCIMDLLSLPYELIPEVFPKGGKGGSIEKNRLKAV